MSSRRCKRGIHPGKTGTDVALRLLQLFPVGRRNTRYMRPKVCCLGYLLRLLPLADWWAQPTQKRT